MNIGTRCYMHNGRIHAERIGEGKPVDVDDFARVFQILCPRCHGLGKTPGGDAITEEQLNALLVGERPHGWDSIDPMQVCRECDGDGVIPDDEQFDEYRFTPER